MLLFFRLLRAINVVLIYVDTTINTQRYRCYTNFKKKHRKVGENEPGDFSTILPFFPKWAPIIPLFYHIWRTSESKTCALPMLCGVDQQQTPDSDYNVTGKAILPPTPSPQQISTPPPQVSRPRPRNHRDNRGRA